MINKGFEETTLDNIQFFGVLLACLDFSSLPEFRSLTEEDTNGIIEKLCTKIKGLIESDNPQYYLVLQKNYDIECKFVRVQAQPFNFNDLLAELDALDK